MRRWWERGGLRRLDGRLAIVLVAGLWLCALLLLRPLG
jgi:hypothetical protein